MILRLLLQLSAVLSVCALALALDGCKNPPPQTPSTGAVPWCWPPPCQTPGASCQQTCGGPSAFECVQPWPGARIMCTNPAPCQVADHCEPNPCFNVTTCTHSSRVTQEGIQILTGEGIELYQCNNDLCCKWEDPKAEGTECPGGTCNGAGVCVPSDDA